VSEVLIRIGRDEVEISNASQTEQRRFLQELSRELSFRVEQRWCG
jgi:hypothetical protein